MKTIGWIITMTIHIGLTIFLYWFAVDLLQKFIIRPIVPIIVFVIHLVLIGIYNGCPLSYLIDQHLLHLFGIEYNIEEYSIKEMWIYRLFEKLKNVF